MHESLFNQYSLYKDNFIEDKYISIDCMNSAVERLHQYSCNISEFVLGKSYKGVDIKCFSIGNGDSHVLMWSQMHGNESTATRVFFDMFRYLSNNTDISTCIKNKLTIDFIPMLNPDGAQVWKRENALNIDINRDANRLCSPESRLLFDIHSRIKPDFAFNLHDQSRYHAAGSSKHPASITLLAPPIDNKGSISDNRLKAIKLVNHIYTLLTAHIIPKQVARWRDDYEPRAFGEKFQTLGTPTVLIEAGGLNGDYNRNQVRHIVYWALIEALYSIAIGDYLSSDISIYDTIPYNFENGMFEHIDTICQDGYYKDIGYRYQETLNGSILSSSNVIEDEGDLSPYGQFDNVNNFVSWH